MAILVFIAPSPVIKPVNNKIAGFKRDAKDDCKQAHHPKCFQVGLSSEYAKKMTQERVLKAATRPDCCVARCLKSSCTSSTLRFLRSGRLALEPLATLLKHVLILGSSWNFLKLMQMISNNPPPASNFLVHLDNKAMRSAARPPRNKMQKFNTPWITSHLTEL